MKKYICLIILIFDTLSAISQNTDKINSKNYYSFEIKKPDVKTNWLSVKDVDSVINNYLVLQKISFMKNVVYRLNNKEIILLDFFLIDKNIGIIYQKIHYGLIQKESRTKSDFVTGFVDSSGTFKRLVFSKPPKNILLLKEDWYWYQTSKENINIYVDKKVISKILKEDLEEKLEFLLK